MHLVQSYSQIISITISVETNSINEKSRPKRIKYMKSKFDKVEMLHGNGVLAECFMSTNSTTKPS
jgi:hypothetical protein